MRISVCAPAGLFRWRELVQDTAGKEMRRSQAGRNLIDKRRSHHMKFMYPFVLLFWALWALAGLLLTFAGLQRANNVYGDICVVSGFLATLCAQESCAQRSRLRLTPNSEFTCWYTVHIIIFMCIVLSADTGEKLIYLQMCTVIPRLVMNLMYFRSGVACCCTALHSITQIVLFGGLGNFSRYANRDELPSFWFHGNIEFYTAMCLILVTVAWERLEHRQIRIEIENAATQSEARASRRLLNTICDATFELDSNLCITSEAAQLAGMLQLGCHRRLRGIMVESLVLQQDRERLRERITVPVPDHQEMANVFHIRLCDSLSTVVNVEVFHVPVYNPWAVNVPEATCHLVGVREFVDFRDTVDCELSSASGSHKLNEISSKRTRSRRSAARGSAPASLQGDPGAAAASKCSRTGLVHDSNPFQVKFYADSMEVLDATGSGTEACVPGSCLRSVLQPEQELFMDIQMGCHALRDMLLSDPDARFQFRSSVTFNQGAVREAFCSVTLTVEGAAQEGSAGVNALPSIVASLQVEEM